MEELKQILYRLKMSSFNIEETCCGIDNFAEDYMDSDKRVELIEEVEDCVEELKNILDELKEFG